MKNLSSSSEASSLPEEPNGKNNLFKVTQTLEEMIVLGQLNPRERLIEDELCEQFSVKRHVVRQVLVALEHLGLVERIPNRGAVVRMYSAQEVENIHGVRKLIETHAASLFNLPLPDAALEELEDIQSRHSDAVSKNDFRNVFRLNISFHRALFSHCKNDSLIEAIEIFAKKSHAYRSIFVNSQKYLEWAAAEHLVMIEACRSADKSLLVDACARHLAPAKNYYIETWRTRFPE
ncbi:GntR family transcriptional regulator [Loktanella salsilacus]|uniref:GntR family transcriptional regulator n=1 Tax=Loktanella salsilacus TaxID=195913 RepID=UPI0020B7426D|nr:GntR family transcriptional regulator [Loktanella salsilacus]